MEYHKKSYSIEFKISVIDWIKADNRRDYQHASKYFNIQPKTIRNWMDQEEELRSCNDLGRMRLVKSSSSGLKDTFVVNDFEDFELKKRKSQMSLPALKVAPQTQMEFTDEELLTTLEQLLNKHIE